MMFDENNFNYLKNLGTYFMVLNILSKYM